MKLSFKFKIALISFSVSGILLLAFGVAFFAYAYSSGLDRMDRELRALVKSSIRTPHSEQHWKSLAESINVIHGGEKAQRIALQVIGPDEKIIFRSENAHPSLSRLQRPDAPKKGSAPSRQRTRREFDGPPDRFMDESGSPSFRPPHHSNGPPPHHRPEYSYWTGAPASRFTTLNSVATDWRVGIFRTTDISVIVALDMNRFNTDINQLRTSFMISVPLGLLVLGILGWFLADRAMRPVAIIADTAASISAKELDKRIPKVGNDIELVRLVTVSNNMLERLEKSYHQAVRFSADAAHELQTPLTILQGELDNAIQTSEIGSAEQQRYGMLLEELRNLKAVVQKLLLLAHADEGRLNVQLQTVDLTDLIVCAAEDIEIMAPELQIKTNLAAVTIQADPALLNQTVRNMISNAAKYTRPNGQAFFTLESDSHEIRFTLANTAPPIPDEDQPLLFDRFHRVDKSRTSGGSGLGLSLAREIARAHGGDLVLNPYCNETVSFTLTLPLA